MSHEGFVPNCAICTQPVILTESKADEDGQAVHENCYVSTLVSKKVRARAVSDRPSFIRTVQKPFLVRRNSYQNPSLPMPQRVNGGFWY